MSEETKEVGTITITVSDGSLKYDSNMSIPETVLWLEAAKDMAMERIFSNPNEDA